MLCLCSSTSRPGGIRTLSDLNHPSSNDSNSDSDGPQEYYTGGEKRCETKEQFNQIDNQYEKKIDQGLETVLKRYIYHSKEHIYLNPYNYYFALFFMFCWTGIIFD
ncbi:hypothetical protein Hanom_Chr04g00378971 [Helianthus anomalus]